MPEIYSPLRYPGGKSKLSNFLIQSIQSSQYSISRYIEPYAGGAGAALRLLFEEYVCELWINDADPRIFSFWHSIINNTERFSDRISEVPLNVNEWRKQREIYEKRDLRSKFELGFATFYLNRTSRSGIIHAAGPIGGFDQTGNYKIDARFNRTNLIRRIVRIGAYSGGIQLTCEDGMALLSKLDREKDKANQSFVYLDPPYYKKGASLYLNCFDHEQHKALSTFLSSNPGFDWVMTYDDVEEIRSLYANFSLHEFKLNYSTAGSRVGQELLIYSNGKSIPKAAKDALPYVKVA